MRTLLALVGVLLLTLGAGAQAPPAPFGPADRTQIETVVHAYFAAFTAKDWAGMARVFQAPFVSIGVENVTVPTVDDVVARYRGIREPLDQQDYSQSLAAEIRVTETVTNRAIADVHWKRLKKDKTLLVEFSEFLLMSKTSGSWKIAGVMAHPLPLYTR